MYTTLHGSMADDAAQHQMTHKRPYSVAFETHLEQTDLPLDATTIADGTAAYADTGSARSPYDAVEHLPTLGQDMRDSNDSHHDGAPQGESDVMSPTPGHSGPDSPRAQRTSSQDSDIGGRGDC